MYSEIWDCLRAPFSNHFYHSSLSLTMLSPNILYHDLVFILVKSYYFIKLYQTHLINYIIMHILHTMTSQDNLILLFVISNVNKIQRNMCCLQNRSKSE